MAGSIYLLTPRTSETPVVPQPPLKNTPTHPSKALTELPCVDSTDRLELDAPKLTNQAVTVDDADVKGPSGGPTRTLRDAGASTAGSKRDGCAESFTRLLPRSGLDGGWLPGWNGSLYSQVEWQIRDARPARRVE